VGGSVGTSDIAGAGVAAYGGDVEPTSDSTGGDGLVARGGDSIGGKGGSGGEAYGGAANTWGGRGVRAIGGTGGHGTVASGNLKVGFGAPGSGAAGVVATGGNSGPTASGPGAVAIGGRPSEGVQEQPGAGLVGFGGVRGETSANFATGVWGNNRGGGPAVLALSTAMEGEEGVALHGFSMKGYGGKFRSNHGWGVQATGKVDATSSTTGFGLASLVDGIGLQAYNQHGIAVAGISVNNSGGSFSTSSTEYSGILADNQAATPSNVSPVGVLVIGDFVVENGEKHAAVPTSHGLTLLYAVEGPVAMCEDVGVARIVAGRVRVELDPIFAETIDLDDYFVFLSARGQTAGTYVGAQDARGFEIREQGGGTSAIEVSYRIVGRRKGLGPNHRLASIPPSRPPARPALERQQSRPTTTQSPRPNSPGSVPGRSGVTTDPATGGRA
jgi:hypothetical protein